MENKKLKALEEVELEITLLDKRDVVAASGCPTDTCTDTCSDTCTDCGSDKCCAVNAECLSAGTKITMADGSEKNIEDIKEGDFVLTFDHEAGRFVASAVHFVYRSETPGCAFTVSFSNGAELSIVGEHDLFVQESMKYVTLTEENADQFIGKHFYSAQDKAFVELSGVRRETEATDYYEIYTSRALNCVANGMLNVADDVDYMLNIYEFDDDLKADPAALAEDIRKYGLFETSEKYSCSKQEYEDWNMRYINIIVGKGLKIFEEMVEKHDELLGFQKGVELIRCA